MSLPYASCPIVKRQAWIAFLLTCGEFGIAAFLLVHDGHVLTAYLAVTYALRETRGGRQYHEILMDAVGRIRPNRGAENHVQH